MCTGRQMGHSRFSQQKLLRPRRLHIESTSFCVRELLKISCAVCIAQCGLVFWGLALQTVELVAVQVVRLHGGLCPGLRKSRPVPGNLGHTIMGRLSKGVCFVREVATLVDLADVAARCSLAPTLSTLCLSQVRYEEI